MEFWNQQRVINDTWVFDWNMVIQFDPKFARYCYNKNTSTASQIEPNETTTEQHLCTNWRIEREQR